MNITMRSAHKEESRVTDEWMTFREELFEAEPSSVKLRLVELEQPLAGKTGKLEIYKLRA